LIATRYFFSQFWCEFTVKVLKEFVYEDYIFKEREIELRNRMKELEKYSEEIKKKETEKLNQNKSSIFQREQITKRNFFL